MGLAGGMMSDRKDEPQELSDDGEIPRRECQILTQNSKLPALAKPSFCTILVVEQGTRTLTVHNQGIAAFRLSCIFNKESRNY